MEMMAVIRGLESLIEPCEVAIYTDSRYVMDGMTKWVAGWQKRGWINASKEPVRNKDLWHELIDAVKRHKIEWNWVRGHDGHPENERVDKLACAAAEAARR
jgi:ribonuclease HI